MTTCDTLDRSARDTRAFDTLAEGIAAVGKMCPDRIASVDIVADRVSMRFMPVENVTGPRFGRLLHEWARQRGYAPLFAAGLARCGDALDVEMQGADRLSIRLHGNDIDLAHGVVDRLRDVLEWIALGRSDRLFWPWTGRSGDGPLVCIDGESGQPRPPRVEGASAPSIGLLFGVDGLGLARMDDALLACDDEAALAMGERLAGMLDPFTIPPRRIRWDGGWFNVDGLVFPGNHVPGGYARPSAWSAHVATHTAHPRMDATAKDGDSYHDGRHASRWMRERLTDDIRAAGEEGGGDGTGMATPPRGLRLVHLVPGEAPHGLDGLEHAIVLDPHGCWHGVVADDLHSRNVMLVTGATFRVARERIQDEQGVGVAVEPGLIEAFLASIDAEHGERRAWRDADDFNEAAHRWSLGIAAWHAPDGELGEAQWGAFFRRLADRETGFACPPDTTVCRPHLGVPSASAESLPDGVFAPDHSGSTNYLIDPVSGEAVDYAGLKALSLAMASRLMSLGMVPGAVIACVGATGIPGVALFMACGLGGWAFAPIDPGASSVNFRTMLDTLCPALVVVDPSAATLHRDLLEATRHLTLAEFMATDASCALPIPATADATAAILFTSGSTGAPKAMRHTHADFLACSANYDRYVLRLGKDDCLYTPSRMFFAYGLNNLVMALLAGASVVLAVPLPAGRHFADVMSRHGVSVFMAVPVVYKMLLSQGGLHAFDRLRLCVSAGERLSARLCTVAQAFVGVPVIDGIGSTEALSTFISNRPSHAMPGCTGRLVPGFAARLRNEAGEPCRVGEPGLLSLAGDCLAKGIVAADGWFDTQDSFFRDARGRFHYLGRAGSVVKINACWFSPDQLETTLLTHPAIRECAVRMVTDEHGLQRPKAFVVIRDGDPETGPPDALWEALRRLSRSRLGKDHYPHFFEAVDALPRTSSGKLARGLLSATIQHSGVQPA